MPHVILIIHRTFSIIKYPMYPANRPPYQNLPWDPTDTIIKH